MTHEEIIKEYRALMKVHQSNMQVVEMLDNPQVEVRIPFLEEWLDKTLTIYRTQVLEDVFSAELAERVRVPSLIPGKITTWEVVKVEELEHPTN